MTSASDRPTQETPGWGLRLGFFLLVCGFVAVGYGATVSQFFLSDDFNYLNIVLPATSAHEGSGIAAGWVFFRPLTGLTFWFNGAFFGKDPTSYHLLGLAFHAVNAWLVARLAWQVMRSRGGAALAGLSFAVFPAHAEAITWISARADVLCATGILLSVSGWIDHVRGTRRGWSLAETYAGLVWALVAKDSAMVLPFMLAFLMVVMAWRSGRPRPWKAIAVVFGIFAVYMATRFYVLGGFGGHPGKDGSNHLAINLDVATRCTRDAFRFMLAPGTSTVLPWISLGTVAVLAGCAIRFRALWTTAQSSWTLVILFLAILAPVANMVVFNLSNGQETRFLYMPSVFACAGLGALAGGVLHRCPRVVTGLAILLIASYAVGIRLENRRWTQAATQAEDVIQQLRTIAKPGLHTTLLVHGLPDTVDGAYVYRNGFDAAVKWFVDKNLEFPVYGKISRADWDKFSAQRREDPTKSTDILMLRWDPQTKRLITP